MTPHKFHQHDASLEPDDDGLEPELLDLDVALAAAMTPEEYLSAHPEAIASAVEQAVHAG